MNILDCGCHQHGGDGWWVVDLCKVHAMEHYDKMREENV